MESCLSYNQRLSLQNIGIATIHLGQSVRCARYILLHSLSSYSITKGVSYNVECAMYIATDKRPQQPVPVTTTALNEYLGWCYTAKLNFTSSRVPLWPSLVRINMHFSFACPPIGTRSAALLRNHSPKLMKYCCACPFVVADLT